MKKTGLLIAAAVVAALAAGCSKPDHTELYREVRSVDKLVLASMAITKTARLESSDWYTIGKRIALYSYDSHMRAYIDMSQLRPEDLEFDEKRHTVKVTLPPVQTEVAGRDMELRKEYENIGPLRSDLDSKERAEIKERANESFRAEVKENPEFRRQLTESAQRKARQYFGSLFEAAGYEASISYRTSATPHSNAQTD